MTAVYEVFTKISMVNNVSGVLAAVSKDVLSLEGSVGKLQAAFNSLNRTSLAIGGGLAVFGGSAALAGMSKMVEHGEKLVHVKQQLLAAGVKEGEIATSTAKAWEVAGKLGMSASNVLNDIKELRTVFGTTFDATQFIEPLEKMRIVLNAVSEGSGNEAKAAVYEMARAGELKGLQRPEDFMSFFEGMTKAISASGGMVSPKAFAQATQYGRLATKGWDEEFYTQYLPSIIQSMRPTGAGTALMSLFGTLIQGKSSKPAMEAMLSLGLITDPSKLDFNKMGPTGKFHYGAIEQSDLLTKNPAKWAADVLAPLLEKKYGELSVDNPKMIGALGEMFGNRMSAQIIASFALESKRIEKDAALNRQAFGIGFADWALKHDPETVNRKWLDSWENFWTAFTEPLVQPKLDIMNAISDQLNSFAAWAVANASTVEMIGKTLVGVAGAVVAVGALALAASAIGLLGPGLAISAAAFGALLAMDWKGVSKDIKLVAEALKWLWNWFDKSFVTPIINVWKTIDYYAGKMADVLQGMVGWVDKLTKLVEGMIDKFKGIFSLSSASASEFGGARVYSAAYGGGFYGGGGEDGAESYSPRRSADGGAGGSAGIAVSPDMDRAPMPSPKGGGKKWTSWAPAIMTGLMKDFGLTKAQAAGVLGNLGHESAGFSQMQEGRPIAGRGGWGIAQWTGPRRRAFEAWTKARGLDPSSFEANYGFLRHELGGEYAGTIRALKKARTAEEAMMIFENSFERAGVKAYANRRIWTKRAMGLDEEADGKPEKRFTPPKKQSRPIEVHTTLQIDRHELGKATSRVLAEHHEHSRQAPYFNGRGMFTGPDHQFSAG